ncbi:hypothetical protein [Arthrobacter sp. 260]|uniref:hypothetical protein n=1 Tax=Arthrobacter sp. 260 TaxID=2735314 RepID=UPI001491CAC9|nr:hypothetical protein [Arthrobacter sp. 260]NOJ60993.1 hypothetical protein [Arthrobacter sp. 260]
MKYLKLATISLAAVLVLGSAVPGQAAQEKAVDMSPVHGDGYVLVNPESPETEHFPDGRTFMPTGKISPETVVVVTDSDGSLPGAMTQKQLTTMVAEQRAMKTSGQAAPDEARMLSPRPNSVEQVQDEPAYAVMSQRTYSAGYSWVQFSGSSQIGMNADTRLYYWHSVASSTAQWAEGQGLGYYRGYNGSTMGTWSAFYAMGTARSRVDSGASIPWGNVAAVTKFRVRSLNSPIAGGYWGP